ncbi:MAG: FAD-dependent oxidoreductase [Myxococcales bacterium]|nr:FAD-dependent oxidoreductase [Myxococcales bacterium]
MAAGESKLPLNEFLDQELAAAARANSRRNFLKSSAAMVAATMILPSLGCGPKAGLRTAGRAQTKRIAIIGGGIAGLNALHHLSKAGVQATVYEASKRTGGRMYTAQEIMGPGTWTELGGEFIDTTHADMWALAKEFKLELMDYLQASEEALTGEAFFFDGKHKTIRDVVAEFIKFAPKLKADIESLPDGIDWKTTDANAIRLDKTSLADYLTSIGATGWAGTLIGNCYESEYGLSPGDQSALNLLLLISPDVHGGHISWFGESDERYKTRGGNQAFPDALAKQYAANIRLEHALATIAPTEAGGYRLGFAGQPETVDADFVVMAIPFTKLRQLDLTALALPAQKLQCITELGYGTNAKLMLGQTKHHWRGKGYRGLVYADNGVPNGWDNAQLQTPDDGAAGLSILFGGKPGMDVGEGTSAEQRDVFLAKWEQIYPGAKAHHNDKHARMHWPTYPHALGSYVCPRPGQYTTLSGWEQTPVGNLLFAGEHCGGEFAGFMNGAAKSGREAAEELIARLDAGATTAAAVDAKA